jgi:hypothetical protein
MARKAMGCGSFEGALSCKDEQQTCSGGMGSLFATLVTLLLLVLGAFPLAAQTAQDGAASLSSGGFYDTPRDLAP